MRSHKEALERHIWSSPIAIVLLTSAMGVVLSCVPFPCGTIGDSLLLKGKVLDADSLIGLSDVVIGGRTLTGGEETDATSFAQGLGPYPANDGSFELQFVVLQGFCGGTFGPRQPLFSGFPNPDQVEIIILRGACEQRFTIEINENTVVDLDFPEGVLELTDPILVPPCEEVLAN